MATPIKIALSLVVEVDPHRYELITDDPLADDLCAYIHELVAGSYYAGTIGVITGVSVGLNRDAAIGRLTDGVIKEKS